MDRYERLRGLLQRLFGERGIGPNDYALFFTSNEGRFLPGSTPEAPLEELSGFVLDRQGRIFYYWLGWDESQQRPALVSWEPTEPEPSWCEDPEYRRARQQLGLAAA